MYYIFNDFMAGETAIFSDKEKCDRFVKDFLHNEVEGTGECPRENDDYSVTTVKTINPTFEEWYNEDYNED